ncbi:hypothetical protein [Thalassotalea ganghwensis]
MSYHKLITVKSTTLLFCLAINLNVSATEIYSGQVSYLEFNDDGSFTFQLSSQGKPIKVDLPCRFPRAFIAKKARRIIDHSKLTRMRIDIRESFLNNPAIQVSVSVPYCDDKTGFAVVSNIMLGKPNALKSK